MPSNASKCKSCGADIVWITTESGRKMPLDAAEVPVVPNQRGETVAVTLDGQIFRGWPCADSYEAERYVLARISHFATCPDADKHRRRKR